MNNLRKSFYHLEVSVLPGGARKHSNYVIGTVEEAKQALQKELSEEFQWDLLLFYGETVSLSTYIEGKRSDKTDLTKYISVEIPSFGYFSLNPDDENYQEFDYFDDEKLFDAVSEKIYTKKEIKPIIYLDWSKIEIPLLKEPIIEKSDEVLIFNEDISDGTGILTAAEMEEKLTLAEKDSYLDSLSANCGIFPYGWSELELGEANIDFNTELEGGNNVIFR